MSLIRFPSAVLALCMAIIWLQANGTEQQKDGEERVVGGNAAEIGQLPYQLSLQFYGEHFCGASYIESPVTEINFDVAITAKHCVTWIPSDKLPGIDVVGGSVLLSTPSEFEDILKIQKIIVHPTQDIAILILNGIFKVSEGLAGISLQNQDNDEMKEVLVSGWGHTSENGSSPNQLQYAEVPIVPNEKCDEYYGGGVIQDTELCAGLEAGGVDTCQGDSGGPCVDLKSGLLIAVTSWGAGCARPRYPGVYVKTAPFYYWIIQNLEGEL